MVRCLLMMSLFGVLLSVAAGAESPHWPAWRGPTATGEAPGEGYVDTWGPDTNILWRADLPGRGTSTPAVWDGHLFVTTVDQGKNLALCFDLEGREIWRIAVGTSREAKHRKASGSNSSPTTDGKQVFVYFKSGDLACLDFNGQLVWQRNLQAEFGEDTLGWDLGTSPVLTDDHVVVACIQDHPSYLLALDKKTGKLAWRQDRNLPAPEESNQSYTTPAVIGSGDGQVLIVLGADHVTAHDVRNGQELWRVGELNPSGNTRFRSIASPVATESMVIAPYSRGDSLTGIRTGGHGDVTRSHVVWRKEGHSADVPTPAIARERIYICGDKGAISCLDLLTGNVIWEGQLPKNRKAFSSSPIVAAERIYVTREDGTTFVLGQGDEFKLLRTNRLNDPVFATPVFLNSRIYLRTDQFLYCIGHPT